MRKSHWTEEEEKIAQSLMDRGADDAEYRSALGRSKNCYEMRLYRKKYLQEAHRMNAGLGKIVPIVVPSHVLDDRNRRLMAERTLTGILMGDPEPNRQRL